MRSLPLVLDWRSSARCRHKTQIHACRPAHWSTLLAESVDPLLSVRWSNGGGHSNALAGGA